ncbi:MAG TPA: STAS domain-containing protein [Candidatus Acidoferrales bacterium]|jgi:anti-anti-sigma factor|nr:STAS domain-containing protein [Candidatus Acidoferrales bacterium]
MSAFPQEDRDVRDLSSLPLNGKRLDGTQNAIIHESRPEGEILHVFGEVDLTSVDELRSAIDRCAANGLHVIVDLEPCTYIDSTILSVLMRASETYAGRFQIVVPPSGIVRRVFTITSLIGQLPVIEALAGAD